MALHLLLPTHNRPVLLRRCLESLDAEELQATNTTLWVIENGSEVVGEVSQAFAQTLPLRYLHYERGNKSAALNRWLAEHPGSPSDLLVFLDDDVAVEPNSLPTYVEAAAQFGSGHYFGGRVDPEFAQPPPPALAPYLTMEARTFDLSGGAELSQLPGTPLFLGCNWACYRGDLARAGNFSEAFGPGAKGNVRGQESDAQERLSATGCKGIFLARARVRHWVSEHMVTRQWIGERTFRANIYTGLHRHGWVHGLGIAGKLVYSLLLLPLQPRNGGHLYRIAKAAGYFYGLTQRLVTARSAPRKRAAGEEYSA